MTEGQESPTPPPRAPRVGGDSAEPPGGWIQIPGQVPPPTPPPTPPQPLPETQPARPTQPLLPIESPTASHLRLWQGLCGLLLIVAIALVIVTATNLDNGARWQERATKAEAIATSLETKLTKSEESTEAIQKRTIELAAEKAEAEDNALVRKLDAKVTAKVSESLRTCSDKLDSLFDLISRADTLEELNSIAATDAEDVLLQCSEAGASASQLAQYLEDESNK